MSKMTEWMSITERGCCILSPLSTQLCRSASIAGHLKPDVAPR
jgi:hypothetical protein